MANKIMLLPIKTLQVKCREPFLLVHFSKMCILKAQLQVSKL